MKNRGIAEDKKSCEVRDTSEPPQRQGRVKVQTIEQELVHASKPMSRSQSNKYCQENYRNENSQLKSSMQS